MGATSKLLLAMIFVQSGLARLIGTGLGLGLCAINRPGCGWWRPTIRSAMMWFTPVLGGVMVLLVSVVAAAISARPVLKLEPGVVFAGR